MPPRDQQEELHRILGQLEAKVDTLLEQNKAALDERKEIHKRLQSLETSVTAQKTTMAIIAGLVGIFVTLFDNLWPHK
ncbi:hypothetical protein EBZ80_27685 [bacterium]|nr:hypothetical protein [bacterium]